jgi:inosine-uridine nucleoside N-ribohydrolase
MRLATTRYALLTAVLFSLALPATLAAQHVTPPKPVIYSTDLTYTFHWNEDDPFDAAVLLKSPELDIRGIILDNHNYPTDGDKILEKIMEYADRRVKVVKGLGQFKMLSFDDKRLNAAHQEGVELILDTLRDSKEKVTLIAVGSLTDFAVAFVRTPGLLKEKVAAVYVVAGSLLNPVQDYNVGLDPKAFVTIMRSGLPIVWVPVDTSMWYFPAPRMLVPSKNALAHFLLNELLYWQLNHWKQGERYDYYDLGLTMWATPAFVLAVNDPEASSMLEMAPAQAEFDDEGMIKSVQLGVENPNMTVVKAVDGAKLNEFIVSRINR